MKKTIDLLNEVVNLGFDKEKALESIDKSLDDEIGFDNRKPIEKENLSDELYENILYGFKEEAEMKM